MTAETTELIQRLLRNEFEKSKYSFQDQQIIEAAKELGLEEFAEEMQRDAQEVRETSILIHSQA